MSTETLKAIAVVAELTGTEMSIGALQVMEADLNAYPDAVVLRALSRCRRELTGRLTLQAVLKRIEEADGRLGAEEAWALALTADDEAETVVWSTEIAEAFAAASTLLKARDRVGARMAFKEAYERILRTAREQAKPVQWVPSPGTDPERRRMAITAAVEKGLIPQSSAVLLLPADSGTSPIVSLLSGALPVGLLTASADDGATRANLERVRSRLQELRAKAAKEREEREAFELRLKAERQAKAEAAKREVAATVQAEIERRAQA